MKRKHFLLILLSGVFGIKPLIDYLSAKESESRFVNIVKEFDTETDTIKLVVVKSRNKGFSYIHRTFVEKLVFDDQGFDPDKSINRTDK